MSALAAAKAATRILLARLTTEGHTVSDIPEAIKRGLVTHLNLIIGLKLLDLGESPF